MSPQTKPKKLFLLIPLWFSLFLFIFVTFATLFRQSDNQKVEAATSSTVNFQARLLTSAGALVPDGFYNAQFKLYSASSGGSAQWTETYYDSNGVTAGNDNRVRVVNGYLSVYLGSQTALPTIDWSQEEWLTINIGGTTQTATPTWDGEMSPRLKLSAVPYAFTAGTLAETTGGNTSTLDWATQTAARSILLPNESGTLCIQSSTNCGFALSSGSGSYIQNGTSPQTANFNITGTGTVGGNFTVTGQQVSIQPASSLTSGQTNVTQTLTNASSSGGTITGYNQSITISNTSSSSTTKGFNISLADNASSLGNTDIGLSISLTGSNTTRADLGIDSSVAKGIGVRTISSGPRGNTSVDCNGASLGLGLCAGDTGGSNAGGGIYAYTNSRASTNIYDPQGTAVYGLNQGGGTAGAFYGGIKGISATTGNAAYTSIGVYGKAGAGTGATTYGGYFTLDSGSTATSGAALYASNSTIAANILQLQDNTTDVFVVADGGNVTAAGDIAIQGGDLTTNQTTFNLLAGATTALNIGPGSNTAVSINLAGGAGTTGCTIAGATGNLTCDGAIATNATSGIQGWWTRTGTSLSPTTSGDAITTSGNISTTGSGTLSIAGTSTLTGNVGIGIAPAAIEALSVSKTFSSATAAESFGGKVASIYSIADTGLKQGLRVNTSTTHTTGTQADLIGVLSLNTAAGNGGAVTNSSTYWSRNDASTGANVTNARGLWIQDGSGAGTIQNQYGVYVSQLSKGTTSNYAIYTAGTTQSLFGGIINANATGKTAIQLADSGAQNSGLTIGTDTNLYRAGTDVLATDDQFRILGSSGGVSLIVRQSTDTSARWRVTNTGGLEWGDGTSGTLDTNLYRGGAGLLQTDNNLLVKTLTNSTSAFQIQGSGVSGNLLLTGDTLNNRVNIIGDVNIGNRYGNRLFSDNFESGSLGLWDDGGHGDISASTTTTHDGGYSAQVNVSSGSGYASVPITSNNTVYARGWVYIASASTQASVLALQNTPDGQSFVVNRSSGGNLTFWDGVTNVTTDSGVAFTTGAWHLIEMRVTIGASTGVSQVWMDGTQVVNLSSQNNGTSPIGWLTIGDSTGGRTFTSYIDDVVADTVSTGTASSLNVDDSFHVGGTSTFGGNVLVQNTLTTGSLMPAIAGSTGTTDLTTVDVSAGTVGQYSSDAIGLDGFPRISYYDTTNTDLKFVQCTNLACTTNVITTVDVSAGTVGQFNSIAIGTDGFARISYYDTTNSDLKFIQCTNASCSTRNTNTVEVSAGAVGQYTSTAIGLDGFARISYYDVTNGDLKFMQCTNAACTTNVITTVDSATTVGQYSTIAIGTDGFARIAYRDNTNGLKMVRCTNAACTTNNITVIDPDTTGATYTSIAMASDGFARISYYDSINTNLKFALCKNATCTSNEITIVDSADSVGTYTGLAMGTDGFARISYYNTTDGDLMMAQCLNANCSTNNITTVDSVGTVGQFNSIAIGSDGYATITYYDTSNTDLKLARVGNAFTGSNIGTSSSPFGAIYGTTLNVQGTATFQQSVEIDNNLTVNGAIYVNGNIDSTSYSANGIAGLNLTCSSGNALENAVISGGIVTGGDCIGASYARAYNSTNQTITSGTWTTLALNSETDDTDGYHSNVTNNSRLTVSTSGWYHITAQLVFPVNGTGSRQVRVLKNGTTIIGEAELPASAATNTQIPIDVQANLSATDYVEMQVNQNSGGNLATIALAVAGTNPDTYFAISKVQSAGSGVNNTLQQAYDMGNTITTTTGRDIQFTLADTTTDANFLVDVSSGSTSRFAVQNAGTDMFSVNPSGASIGLGANNPGNLQPWQTSGNPLPLTTQNAVTVTANGFVYVIGGATTASDGTNCEGTGGTLRTTSYYAKLNADGSNTSWSTTTALPVGLCGAKAVVANGYVYIAGGDNGTSDVNTVYFARLNADGTLGSWRQNAQNLPTNRDGATMVAANGYLYVIDGSQSWNGSGDSTIYYAQINTDGSTTGWTSSTAPRSTLWASAVTANGYLYLIGGYNSYTTVAYAPLNPSNGSIGTWNNTTSLSAAVNAATSVVANGYVYVMGGTTPTYSSAATNAVYYAKLNSNGTVGSWSSTSSLPTAQEFAGSVVVNGYIYVIGGQSNWTSGTVRSTVYYASTQRIQVGGSLDLVGLAGGNLVNDNPYGAGSVGGSLTAGDTTIVGTIRVQGQASFNSSVTTNGVLTANGGARLSFLDVRRDVQASGENAIRLSTTNGQDWKIYQAAGSSDLSFWSDSTNQDIFKLNVLTGGALFKNGASGGDSNAFRVQSYGGTDFYRADTLAGSNNFGANTNVFQPQADGNVLQVKTAGGSPISIFTTDTSGKNIQIGSSSTDANAVLLTLDSYNTTDPVSGMSNGSMYYSTSKNSFRCYENGTWKNCINGAAYNFTTVSGATAATVAKGAAGTILVTPIYLSGQITVNEMRVRVTTALGAAGDIGIYNSAGTLVLNGGSSSVVAAGTGVRVVAPTQTGTARILEAGQYYMAVTWNSTTGIIAGANLATAGSVTRTGNITGGGLVLPSSITPSSITNDIYLYGFSINN